MFVEKQKFIIAKQKRMVKTYVWAVLLYGCETWTISRNMEKRLEAAEMWMWRRVLNVSWTERVRNERILERMGTERELLKTIRKRQLQFLGWLVGWLYEYLTLHGTDWLFSNRGVTNSLL